MKLSRAQLKTSLSRWIVAWNAHDLNSVMELLHDDVLFENWTGSIIKGKENLRNTWQTWFENHGEFQFIEEETFIDEVEQKALFRWLLIWPSLGKNFKGKVEKRNGVDVLHFKEGKIIKKLTYSKTIIKINGKRVHLKP